MTRTLRLLTMLLTIAMMSAVLLLIRAKQRKGA